MNVSVVQVQTPKTQMYLYWVRVTNGYWTNTYFFSGGFAGKCLL